MVFGLSTASVFVKELKSRGWKSVKSRRKTYNFILKNVNSSGVAYILVRKNGVDIQVIPCDECEAVSQSYVYDRSLTEGVVVRHYLAHTSFNLFEGIVRFAISFSNNEADLGRYFVPQGSTDKRTEQLKVQAEKRRASAEREKADLEYWDAGDIGDYPDDMYLGYHMK